MTQFAQRMIEIVSIDKHFCTVQPLFNNIATILQLCKCIVLLDYMLSFDETNSFRKISHSWYVNAFVDIGGIPIDI